MLLLVLKHYHFHFLNIPYLSQLPNCKCEHVFVLFFLSCYLASSLCSHVSCLSCASLQGSALCIKCNFHHFVLTSLIQLLYSVVSTKKLVLPSEVKSIVTLLNSLGQNTLTQVLGICIQAYSLCLACLVDYLWF